MIIISFIVGGLFGMFLAAIVKVNGKSCLHCGKHDADYCESCYQDLISENARLQAEIHLEKVETYKSKVENPEMFIVEQHIPRID